jgi:hypothetical protein
MVLLAASMAHGHVCVYEYTSQPVILNEVKDHKVMYSDFVSHMDECDTLRFFVASLLRMTRCGRWCSQRLNAI